MKPRDRRLTRLIFSFVVFVNLAVCQSPLVAHAEDGGTSAKAASFEFNPEWRKDDPEFRSMVIEDLENPGYFNKKGNWVHHKDYLFTNSQLTAGVGGILSAGALGTLAKLASPVMLRGYSPTIRNVAVGGYLLSRHAYYESEIQEYSRLRARKEESQQSLHERIKTQIAWEFEFYTKSLSKALDKNSPEDPRTRLDQQRLSNEDQAWIRLHGAASWLEREKTRPGGYNEQVKAKDEARRAALERLERFRNYWLQGTYSAERLVRLFPEIVTPRLRQMIESQQAAEHAARDAIADARTKDVQQRIRRAEPSATGAASAQ